MFIEPVVPILAAIGSGVLLVVGFTKHDPISIGVGFAIIVVGIFTTIILTRAKRKIGGKMKVQREPEIYNQPALIAYGCLKDRYAGEKGNYCSDCGKLFEEIHIGVTCQCGSKFIFPRKYCGNCGLPLRARRWAAGAYNTSSSPKGDKWEGISIFPTSD